MVTSSLISFFSISVCSNIGIQSKGRRLNSLLFNEQGKFCFTGRTQWVKMGNSTSDVVFNPIGVIGRSVHDPRLVIMSVNGIFEKITPSKCVMIADGLKLFYSFKTSLYSDIEAQITSDMSNVAKFLCKCSYLWKALPLTFLFQFQWCANLSSLPR